MKLEIMGFSQQGLMDLGLGIEDAMLLRWFVDFQGSSRMKPIADPETGKTYHWVNFRKVVEDLPVITKSDRWISERFNKLVTCGLLEKYSTTSAIGRVSAFRIAENEDYLSLIFMSVKTDMAHVSKNRHGMSVKTDMAMSAATDMVSNTNSLPRNNNTVDSQQGDKPACAPVRTMDNQKSDIEEFLGDDKELRDTFKAFIEMRVKQRKPMTDYAKTLLVKKLRVLAEDRQGWIAILNQSIENSWQSVYPVHSNDRNNTGKPVRTPVSNAAFDGQQGGETVW